MNWRAQIALSLLCGAILAGIAHIATVLAMPWFNEQDAYSRLRGISPSNSAQILPLDAEWAPEQDPSVVLAACTYNLAEGPKRISARTGALFESLSFHARGGVLYYAVTDRAAVRGALDLVVMTRAQQQAASEEDGDETSPEVRIVAPQNEGFLIVRVLTGLPSQREEAEALAKAVTCSVETAAN